MLPAKFAVSWITLATSVPEWKFVIPSVTVSFASIKLTHAAARLFRMQDAANIGLTERSGLDP